MVASILQLRRRQPADGVAVEPVAVAVEPVVAVVLVAAVGAVLAPLAAVAAAVDFAAVGLVDSAAVELVAVVVDFVGVELELEPEPAVGVAGLAAVVGVAERLVAVVDVAERLVALADFECGADGLPLQRELLALLAATAEGLQADLADFVDWFAPLQLVAWRAVAPSFVVVVVAGLAVVVVDGVAAAAEV